MATADAGYSNGKPFQACDGAKITAYVPVNREINNQSDDTPLFERDAFTYDATHDQYQCPAGKWLPRKQVNGLLHIYAVRTDCTRCPLKPRCTNKAKRRYVTRHVHEAAFERMHQRMQAHPEMMVRRRSIVEHPFGNLNSGSRVTAVSCFDSCRMRVRKWP